MKNNFSNIIKMIEESNISQKILEKLESLESKVNNIPNKTTNHKKVNLNVDDIHIFNEKNDLNLIFIGLINQSKNGENNMIKIISMNSIKFLEIFNEIEKISIGTSLTIKDYSETKKQGIYLGGKWIIQK